MRKTIVAAAMLLLVLGMSTRSRAETAAPPRSARIAALYKGGTLLLQVGGAGVLAPLGVELLLQGLASKAHSSGSSGLPGPSSSSAMILGEPPVLILMGASAAVAAGGGAMILGAYLRERKLRRIQR